jgi:hypothetical protein
MAATPRQILQAMLLREPPIRLAFLAIVAQWVGDARTREIEQLIAAGRVDDIAPALGIEAAALATLTEAIRSAFVSGGTFGAEDIPTIRRADGPGGVFRLRFDVRNVRAEAWIREHAAQFVTVILRDQRDAIRGVVNEGARLGLNPRTVALDIAGRVSPQTGRRTGGIVGLTSQQAGFVMRARQQLLSGDPAEMRGYFTRQLRDRRFDALVRRAMDAGKPVALKDAERILSRYSDRLLRLRAETIARTEALSAFNAGRDEAVQQLIDTGQVRPQAVTKTWRTAADARVRDAHSAMAGQKIAFDQPFRSPTGALLRYPGDTSLGAGAADVANCRCIAMTRIDYLGEAARG